MRLTVLLGAIASLASAPAISMEEKRQARFSQAMDLIEQGHPRSAVELLDALYMETHEPRVRLELARAAFLSHDLERARKYFIQAYEDNPPPPVKARILQFIEDIDRQSGKMNFSLSARHARNPYRMPNQFGINFAGNQLNLEQNPKQRNVYGLLYTGSFEKKISPKNDIRLQGSFRDLEHKAGDFGFVDMSIGHNLKFKPVEIRAGFQILNMNKQSYQMPYVEMAYQISPASDIHFIPRFQIGLFQPRDEGGMAGTSYKLNLPMEFIFNAHRTVTFGVKIERRSAKFTEQAFWAAGPYFESKFNFNFINISSSLSWRKINYDATDPFWSTRRRDTSFYANLSAETDYIQFHSMIPSIGIYCDIGKSNIDYYTARDCGISTNLRKIY